MESGELEVGRTAAPETGEEISLTVKEYNFRRPMKFSKEQLRTLQLIHENLTRDISTYLSARVRSFVNVTFASIDQITFAEFQQSLVNPNFLAVFGTDVMPGNAVFQMTLDIGYVIIDKLLGGPGIPGEAERPPTELEIAILKKEVVTMIKLLSKAWNTIVSFDTQLEKVETNPQFVQVAPPNEMTVLITLSVNLEEVQGFINICWPSSILEPISEKLTTRFWAPSGLRMGEEEKERLKNIVLLSEGNISAVLGKTQISIKDFLNLSIGDIIRLNSFHSEPIDVNIENVTVFKGNPGVYKGYYAVKIVKEDPELLKKLILQKVSEQKL